MECVATEATAAPVAVVAVEEPLNELPKRNASAAAVAAAAEYSFSPGGFVQVTRQSSWVAELALEKSTLAVGSEGTWSQFSHVAENTATNVATTTAALAQPFDEKNTTGTNTSSSDMTVTPQSSWVAELTLEKSTLGVESEGAWSQFSHVTETTCAVVVAPSAVVVVDQHVEEEKEEEAEEQHVQVTLKLAPVIPEPDEWIVHAAAAGTTSSGVAPLPSFDDAEKRRHKILLARMCAMRAKQQVLGVVSRLMSRAGGSASCTTTAAAKTKKTAGCVCTNETCGSYFRLENEAAELLMLEGAQRAVKTINVTDWAGKYVGPGQCSWPVRDDAEEAAMTDLGLPPSPLCSVRLVSSYEEHLSLVRRMILGARSTVRIMSCYFFANEPSFVHVITDLLPEAARRGVRVRLLLDALPAQSALVKATAWGPLLTPYVQGSAARLEFVKFYNRTLPAAAERCPEGTFRVAFFKAEDARGGYAIKSHMKMFGVDGRLTIIGGSNMLPTKATGSNDCDCLVDGEAAAQLDAYFRDVWMEQTGESLDPAPAELVGCAAAPADAAAAAATAALARVASSSPSGSASAALHGEGGGDRQTTDSPPFAHSHPLEASGEVQWHERGVRFAPVMSRPGHQGEDAILRAVIGLVDSAREEFLMCMGFCALHTPLVASLARASRRGVRVRLLLNSHYSCDLRPPMGDLVAGARALLLAAPDAEVYMTGPREAWDVREEEASGAAPRFVPSYSVAAPQEPPYSHPFTFVHGKYCVADRRRCSVGSWNAWARSAFHEAEMNVMVESAALGEELARKWGVAARMHAARVRDEGALAPGGSSFAPSGCDLCAPFGGFCADAVERATKGTLPLAETA